jgi:hypothetical protein
MKHLEGLRKPNADQFPSLHNAEGNVVQLQRLTHRHLAIMDFMLANPVVPMSQVAVHFKVSQAWLSTVRNSDLFVARLNERRKLMDEDQAYRIGTKMAALAEKGIDAMSGIMEDVDQSATVKLDATKTALETLGFLGKNAQPAAPQQAPVQVNIGMSAFESAREKAMLGHRTRPALGDKS